jgi:NADH-quinone oxidoreductase subunit M
VGPGVDSREISLGDRAVLVPLIAVILFFALYPQVALHRSESSVDTSLASSRAALQAPRHERTAARVPEHAAAGSEEAKTSTDAAGGSGTE